MNPFPILYGYSEQRQAQQRNWPRTVSLALLAPHERQARINHKRTLRWLAEFGGLTPVEILAVLTDRDYRDVEGFTVEQALAGIADRQRTWEQGRAA